MKRHLAKFTVLFLSAALSVAQTPPPDTTKSAPPVPTMRIAPPAHEVEKTIEFPIGESVGRGDLLAVSIKIDGKEHLFVVDTGSSGTVIDSTLAQREKGILGLEKGDAPLTPAYGQTFSLKTFRAPPLEVAGQSLKNADNTVIVADLEQLRELTGRPVEGILGLNILCNYVTRFDFRHHIVQLIDPFGFEAPSGNHTKSWPLLRESAGVVVSLPLAALPDILVGIDTGFYHVGGISAQTLEKIPQVDRVITNTSPLAEVANNTWKQTVYIKRKWSIGDTEFENIPLEITGSNLLGLNALADFIVTIDFSQHTLYLESINDKHPPVPPNLEFFISLKEGHILVHNLTERAKSLDIKVNDEILAVDGKDISKTELWLVREQLQMARTPVLRLKRGDQTHEVTLHHDQTQPASTSAP